MNFILLALTGLIGGITSGLFGVGGGLIFVPLLVLIRKSDIHVAIATSLAVVIPTVLVGVFKHSKAGMVDWKVVPIIAVFAIVGAWVGSTLSIQMDTILLRRLFAVFLVAVAVKMCFPN